MSDLDRHHPIDATTAYARLDNWRRVGDGPVQYCAGNKEFGNDVIALLSRIETLESALRWYAEPIPVGKFSIRDESGEFVSDMSSWGDHARTALGAQP